MSVNWVMAASASAGRAGVASGGANRYLARMNASLPVPPRQRKPDWIRVKAPVSEGYAETAS